MSSLPSAHFNNFSWPSLYSPAKEVGFVGPAVRPGGYYLTDLNDVFRFTLYWTLIFHLPFNFIAGDTIVLTRVARPRGHTRSHSDSQSHAQLRSRPPSPPPVDEWLRPLRVNARRSRWTFALLVLLAFLGFSLVSAVVGAAVLALVLVGVYRAGGFYLSTWIPFLWAVIQSLIALLEIWPSVVDII